jgi:hypothetical protein
MTRLHAQGRAPSQSFAARRSFDESAIFSTEQSASLGGRQKVSLQTEPQAVLITPNVQRQKGKDDEEDNPILTKSAGSMADSFEPGADVETQVSLSKGRGSPLPEPVRAYMEPRFGVDFNQVRVHTGSDSTHLNRALSAQAFTVARILRPPLEALEFLSVGTAQ